MDNKRAYIVMHSFGPHEDPEPVCVSMNKKFALNYCETRREECGYDENDEYRCFYVLDSFLLEKKGE